jgi:hypothetical protein
MKPIRKKIITDESMHPIAVQLEYEDWLEVEKALASMPGFNGNGATPTPPVDLNRFSGTVKLSEDAVEFQRRIRGEWT